MNLLKIDNLYWICTQNNKFDHLSVNMHVQKITYSTGQEQLSNGNILEYSGIFWNILKYSRILWNIPDNYYSTLF